MEKKFLTHSLRVTGISKNPPPITLPLIANTNLVSDIKLPATAHNDAVKSFLFLLELIYRNPGQKI